MLRIKTKSIKDNNHYTSIYKMGSLCASAPKTADNGAVNMQNNIKTQQKKVSIAFIYTAQNSSIRIALLNFLTHHQVFYALLSVSDTQTIKRSDKTFLGPFVYASRYYPYPFVFCLCTARYLDCNGHLKQDCRKGGLTRSRKSN